MLHTWNVSNVQHRRWTFYLATIIVAVTGIVMFSIGESHASLLLERKVVAIQSHRADLILRTAPTAPRPSVLKPVTLFVTKPIILLSSLTNAFSTALLYLFAVAFPLIYAHYAWSRQKTTLIFLFIALGLFLSTITRFHDRHCTRKYHLANRRLAPEKSLFGLAIGAPMLAVGLWWFAWTIPGAHAKDVAWPASAVSLILLGYGLNESSTVLPRYVLESHKGKTDAASAFVATLVTRALLCAVFPLFTQPMFEQLGANSAGSVLAAIATAFCLLPFILINFGAKMRGSGRSGGADGEDESGREAPVERKMKPRKTVRWGDETDSSTDGSSETKSEDRTESGSGSESESESSASSEISRTETQTETETETEQDIGDGAELSDLSTLETTIETRDFANGGISENENDNDNENENEGFEISRLETQKSESSSSDSAKIARVETKGESVSGGGGGGGVDVRKKEKKRIDDKDNGAVGLMGLDLERLAVFPYF